MPTDSYESLLNREFHWPTLGDKLFSKPKEPVEGGRLAPHPFERLVHMISGYREAADILVEGAREQYSLRGSLVYPIIFLYRHFLELELKYVLTTYGLYLGQPADWENHDLEKLWIKVRGVIDHFALNEDKEGTDAIEACIVEMAKIDRGSFTFRYPVSKKGEPLSLALESLDLVNLRMTMEKIHNFFLGVDGQLDHATSA
jgi:hypothetical protein